MADPSAAKRATIPVGCMGVAARHALVRLIKARARAYGRQPSDLNALHLGLSPADPDALIAVARHLLERETIAAPRWFGFGGEVRLVNARAALLLGRTARRRAAHRQEPTGEARVCSAAPWVGAE